MPSKKKKYNARFPAGRIKKIMQTDEEVGKVAQAVPVIISRTLELFVHSLLTKTMQITSAKNARTLTPTHIKQCILSESRFDFLKDLVKNLPDVSSPDEEVPTPPLTPAPPIVQSFPLSRNVEHESSKETGPSIAEPNYSRRAIKEEMIIKEERPVEQSTKPEFQIIIPAAYGSVQPNFYTEVNASTNAITNSYTHTSNIDEDYDT